MVNRGGIFCIGPLHRHCPTCHPHPHHVPAPQSSLPSLPFSSPPPGVPPSVAAALIGLEYEVEQVFPGTPSEGGVFESVNFFPKKRSGIQGRVEGGWNSMKLQSSKVWEAHGTDGRGEAMFDLVERPSPLAWT